MDLADTMIFGFIAIFLLAIIGIIGFVIVGGYIKPQLENVANTTPGVLDVPGMMNFGVNLFYIAIGILIAIPFVLIIYKFFYEKEPYTY